MKNQLIEVKADTIKVFDGFENELFNRLFEVEIVGYGKLEINPQIVDDNKFKNLGKSLGEPGIDIITEKKKFDFKTGIFPGYVGTDGLELKYLFVKDLVLVFSLGEYQPSRYIFYLEGAWKLI